MSVCLCCMVVKRASDHHRGATPFATCGDAQILLRIIIEVARQQHRHVLLARAQTRAKSWDRSGNDKDIGFNTSYSNRLDILSLDLCAGFMRLCLLVHRAKGQEEYVGSSAFCSSTFVFLYYDTASILESRFQLAMYAEREIPT